MRRIPTRTNASWHSVVCPPKKDNGYQKPRTAAQLANIASWRLIKQVPGQSAVQVINATLGISAALGTGVEFLAAAVIDRSSWRLATGLSPCVTARLHYRLPPPGYDSCRKPDCSIPHCCIEWD
ncbi:hypothetical protein F9C07_2281372 [Aspergillus flavus]|uniref:Uncharacterized protein n=1 Tax=Aspergillus flavus (strain ATCC 200026 / FGSC A1120 / IAM 13836 / NRRL 3357 / JCM 12722 / SRRC 167) TaxID=332952 RepID=A0A7U2MK38_ASPFN|nr:hypothetical protein F9C07_2281372 [Aspergillus flavus]